MGNPVTEFLQTALAFPTVVYSVLLAVGVVYWMMAATGLVDGDAPDAQVDAGGGEASGAAAMLSRLGLAGVPLPVVVTVLSFAAWFGTYFVHLLALRHVPEGLRVLAGTGTLLAMLVPAVGATSLVLRPVSRALSKLGPAEPSLLGRTGVVITPTLTSDYGQASFDDGGAGLILQVRCDDAQPLRRGDRVVLIEPMEGRDAYRVVSEQQFLRPSGHPIPQARSQ
jgi:hypothetical protein